MNPSLDSLASLVRDTEVARVHRQALLVQFDQLPPLMQRPHHRRLARAALDPLLDADRSRLHELPGGRLAVSWRGEAADNLRQTMASLNYLLTRAPVATPPIEALARLFHLPQDGPALLAAVEGRKSAPKPRIVPPVQLAPLDAATVSRLEANLAQADIERFVRRRPVCAAGVERLSLAWDERTLDYDEIAAELAPGRSLTADSFLFRRLSRTLDRRMLALLATAGVLDRASPFAMRLGPESLVSPEFLRFDANLPGRLRGQVVIGFTPGDVVANPADFAFARDFAKARRYKVLLRAVEATMLPVLALSRLELDFVQVTWSSVAMAANLDTAGARLVVEAVDTGAAVEWAQAHRIPFVQGRAAVPEA
jgi:hypothetical protein